MRAGGPGIGPRGERPQHPPPLEGAQGSLHAVAGVEHPVGHRGVVPREEAARRLGHAPQPSGGDLHSEGRRHDVFDGVSLVEHHHVVLGEHAAVARHV